MVLLILNFNLELFLHGFLKHLIIGFSSEVKSTSMDKKINEALIKWILAKLMAIQHIASPKLFVACILWFFGIFQTLCLCSYSSRAIYLWLGRLKQSPNFRYRPFSIAPSLKYIISYHLSVQWDLHILLSLLCLSYLLMGYDCPLNLYNILTAQSQSKIFIQYRGTQYKYYRVSNHDAISALNEVI